MGAQRIEARHAVGSFRAAGAHRIARGLPEPVPAGHADEAAGAEGGRGADARGARRPRRPGSSRSSGARRWPARASASAASSIGSSACSGAANVYIELQRHLLRDEEAGQPRARRSRLRVSRAGHRDQRRPLRRAGRSPAVRRAHLHPSQDDARARRPAAGVERRALSQAAGRDGAALRGHAGAPWRRRASSPIASATRWPISATAFPSTRCPPARRWRRSCGRSRRPARASATGRTTSGRARQVERELDLIEKLDLAGYFLIVWDIVNYCRQHDILVQGRGSAANSAVCYSLGITAVDPVGMDLLFERFLSEERGEWPDIDLDLPSGDRRERVIQHMYDKYRGDAVRGAPDRDDGQRDHLPRPQRRARSRQGAVARARADRSARQGDEPFRVGRSQGHARAQPPRGRPGFPAPRDSDIRPAVDADPGSAAPPRPAFRRHGDVPGPARRRRPARERHHARPRRRAVGQGRLRRHGHRESRSARPGHDVGAAGRARAGEYETWERLRLAPKASLEP